MINCGGFIDEKHIQIIPPTKTAGLYYNYRHF
jgi:hypothetical protein